MLPHKRPVIIQRRGELKRENWGERSVDMFERLEIIGEGTYGKVANTYTSVITIIIFQIEKKK